MTDAQILIIEDNPADAMLLMDMLRERGIDAPMHHVLDGVHAITYLKTSPRVPLVITLDINLPQLGGRKLIDAIRALHTCTHLPLFVLSGSAAPADVALGELPRVTYFQKPEDINDYAILADAIHPYIATTPEAPHER